ncbi:MAG: hypothetical protein GXX99_05605 [Clostridiales bacterium]|nr:hypothetical protein [Clostridiales bacterium]
MRDEVLPKTPMLAIYIMLAIVGIEVVYCGEKAVKRLARWIAPAFTFGVLLLVALQIGWLLGWHHMEKILMDLLAVPLRPEMLKPAALLFFNGIFKPWIFSPIFFQEMDRATFVSAQRRGLLLSLVTVLPQFLLPVLTLGVNLMLASAHPYYVAVNLQVFGSSLVRLDNVAATIVLTSQFLDLGCGLLVAWWFVKALLGKWADRKRRAILQAEVEAGAEP